jgi:hypothetical protein
LSWQRTAFHFQPEQNWMNGTQSLKIIIYYWFCYLLFCKSSYSFCYKFKEYSLFLFTYICFSIIWEKMLKSYSKFPN